MVEIDGGEAEKIVAAESSNCRHLSSSLVVSWMWLANSKMGQDWIYLFCNFLWAVIIPPLKQRSRSLSLSFKFQVLASLPTRPREKKSSKPHTGEWKSWKASHDGRPKLNTGKSWPCWSWWVNSRCSPQIHDGFCSWCWLLQCLESWTMAVKIGPGMACNMEVWWLLLVFDS